MPSPALQNGNGRPAATQQNRFLGIETPLGEGVLLLTSLQADEQLSRPFAFQTEMLSTDQSIEPERIVGRTVSIRVGEDDGTPRHFHGYVRRFSAGGRQHEYQRYTAEIVPWLWFLDLSIDCRIFQDKTVPEIITEVFRDHGFSDFDTSDLRGRYRQREYCVQYRETDLAFVSRLMEDEGIFYYFRHEQQSHTLVLADGQHTFRHGAQREIRYQPRASARNSSGEIHDWNGRQSVVSGRWAVADYNFQTPRHELRANENSISPQATGENFEVFEYPGGFEDRDEGYRRVRMRMEEEETRAQQESGTSSALALSAGARFQPQGSEAGNHDRRDFVVTSIQHSAYEPAAYPGQVAEGPDYENTFTCIPESVNYRPPRNTPGPNISSVQTALVTGPPGEEIWTDRFGRVKVQFHWDRLGHRDDHSSCWVRVAQNWAGARWGAHFWPRVGHEVVVTFVDGDPDRPLVLGCVYNADNMPPYALPDHQTRSGIKTRSTPGGGAANFNEIRFEDQMGKEEVYLHAERALNSVVEADETRSVGHDQEISIDHDRKVSVKNDDLLDVTEVRKVTAKKILFNAQQEIQLSCGGGTIKIDAAGNITVNGTLVRIN